MFYKHISGMVFDIGTYTLPHARPDVKVGYALAMQTFKDKDGMKLPDGKFYIVRSKEFKRGYTKSPKKMLLIQSRDKARDMRFKHIETIWKVAVLEDKTMIFLKKNP